jgi:hypothetical protein
MTTPDGTGHTTRCGPGNPWPPGHNHEGTTAMTTIHADELRPGDIVFYDGHDRCITRVDRRAGWAWPIAADDTGWAIALDHHLINVNRTYA